jgi:hypothetical protein
MSNEKQWNVISLGGGVQSSAMALMASCGELGPMPDCAVFADTQDEPASVYRWLDWLEPKLAFPVYRVTKGSLSEQSLKMKYTKDGRAFSKTNIPFFTKSVDGEFGMIPFRSCTVDFKIGPILKFIRKHCGIKRGQKHPTVTSWIGISLDEQQRMKDSRDPWVVNRWPLIEKRIDRNQCVRWMLERGYPEPPKSACRYCPFHSNKEWRRIKTEEPEEFALAVQFEKDIQRVKSDTAKFRTTPYLHASRKPLDEIDFRNDIDHGQQTFGFMDECEGMCGV